VLSIPVVLLFSARRRWLYTETNVLSDREPSPIATFLKAGEVVKKRSKPVGRVEVAVVLLASENQPWAVLALRRAG